MAEEKDPQENLDTSTETEDPKDTSPEEDTQPDTDAESGTEDADTSGADTDVEKGEDTEPEEDEFKHLKINEPDFEDFEEEADDEDIPEEDRKVIDSRVKKQVEPIKTELKVERFIQANPNFEGHRSSLIKTMRSKKGLSMVEAAKIVAFDDAVKIGATRERAAQSKANKSKGVGDNARKPEGAEKEGKDWTKAPKEEWEQKLREVKGQA